MYSLSIIIATRNRSALLPRAVESARRAGTEVEVIIVDDASEDQTETTCRAWRNDSEVRCLRLRHRQGVGGARNVGIMASRSPFIAFLDDDDLRLPLSLDHQLKLLEDDSAAGMIYGKAFYGDGEGRTNDEYYPCTVKQGDLFWDLLEENFIPCATVIFRRDCINRVGLLDQSAPGVEDWDLWVRIAELYRIIAIEEPVAIWRRPTAESGQFTSTGHRLHREAYRLLRRKWLQLPRVLEATADQRRAVKRRFVDRAAQQLTWEAAEQYRTNGIAGGLRSAIAAIEIHPAAVIKKLLTWPLAYRGRKPQREAVRVPVAPGNEDTLLQKQFLGTNQRR